MRHWDEAPDILLVDDTPANLHMLSDLLRAEGYRTRSARSGEMALRAASTQCPDLVLLDVMMPGMDGYEVCRRMKSAPELAGVPVIFLSALAETEDKVEAFAVGAVDYVTKPLQIDEVRARVKTHLRLRRLQLEIEQNNRELERRVEAQVREIADSQMATIFAMARLAESRDDETGTHLERVRAFCHLLVTGLATRCPHYGIGADYIRDVVHASPLHDIGKVAISDTILLKPDRLTPAEFEIMKTHTTLGARTLESVRDEYPGNGFVTVGIDIAQSHHEWWDGSGYPDGLAGEEIPLSARVMALADVYDALRSERVYKPAIPHDESCKIIWEEGRLHFDPDVVGVFFELEGEFDRVVRENVDPVSAAPQ